MMTKTTTYLTNILADTYVLYYQTQACHWNVEGAHFFELHKAFEGQYEELAKEVDELAERLRAIGAKAPMSLKALLAESHLVEMTKDMNAKEMIQLLHDSHMVLSDKMRKAMDDCEAEDPVTADLFMQKLHWHHMQVWMLKSCLVV